MATSSTCWQRHQSASPSTSRRVVPGSRTSCARRPGRDSCGTRTHTINVLLPMSIPHTRCTSSTSSSTSSTRTTSPENRNGGCPRRRYRNERGGLACSKQQCRAPEDHTPASDYSTASTTKQQRRRRATTPDLHAPQGVTGSDTGDYLRLLPGSVPGQTSV